MKIIRGNLELKEDTTFNESIKVEGNIMGYFNLTVEGDINAWDINAWDIDARDIDARNIDAGDINAGDIDAGNINAWDINAGDINAGDIDARNINAGDINAGDIDARNIICEKRRKKSRGVKTICRVFIQKKSKIEKKERME